MEKYLQKGKSTRKKDAKASQVFKISFRTMRHHFSTTGLALIKYPLL